MPFSVARIGIGETEWLLARSIDKSIWGAIAEDVGASAEVSTYPLHN